MKKEPLYNLLQYFKAFTIRRKLLLSYFILIFIPLFILTVVSYVNISRKYEDQLQYSSSQSFDQACKFLDYKLYALIRSSDIVYFDNGVQTILNRKRAVYVKDIIQQNIDMGYLNTFLNNFKDSQDIYRVGLYVQNGLMYSDQGINFSNMDLLKVSPVYKKLMLSKDKVLWLTPEVVRVEYNGIDSAKVISLLRKIRNSNNYGDIIGIVKVSILESTIQEIIKKANIIRNGVVYIQNSDGVIICSTNDSLLKEYNLKNNIVRMLGYNNADWEIMKAGKRKFAINARSIENTDWKMITAIPYSEILSQSNKIRDLMLCLMLILGAVSYLLAYIFSTSSTKRISLLMENMIRVQEGDLEVTISTKGQDEIDQLMNSFNFMVKRVNVLLAEQYKNGKEIKNAELKSLQAQINPHFLYNTLDLINWKAIDNDIPEIVEISQSLAKFYKLSLNKGKNIVTIKDEVEHVMTYVQIQNLRFDNRINFITDIEEDIYQYSILKIILQPIVENSILHGILENRDKQEGHITLSGRMEDHSILLTVQDDGIGMTEEKAKEILAANGRNSKNGYGVRNIDNRIKLCYGQEYGLSFYSSVGNGTRVEIRLPAVKADEE